MRSLSAKENEFIYCKNLEEGRFRRRKYIQYVAQNCGEIYAQKFREKVIASLEKISKYPFIGRVAKNDKSLRVLILNNKNKLIY